MSIIDKLLDADNTENITLRAEDGTECEFEQIAVIPYNEELYCFLHPLDDSEGFEPDEGLVFLIDVENDSLVLEEDEDTLDAIYDIYLKLYEDNNADDSDSDDGNA